jgi:hypothetical protein
MATKVCYIVGVPNIECGPMWQMEATIRHGERTPEMGGMITIFDNVTEADAYAEELNQKYKDALTFEVMQVLMGQRFPTALLEAWREEE